MYPSSAAVSKAEQVRWYEGRRTVSGKVGVEVFCSSELGVEGVNGVELEAARHEGVCGRGHLPGETRNI